MRLKSDVGVGVKVEAAVLWIAGALARWWGVFRARGGCGFGGGSAPPVFLGSRGGWWVLEWFLGRGWGDLKAVGARGRRQGWWVWFSCKGWFFG